MHADPDGNKWEHFNPGAPVTGFHFANVRALLSSELKVIERELVDREQPAWLFEALERGIGVHHAGMNRRYRQT